MTATMRSCKAVDGTVVTWNPAAEKLFGFTASDIVGQSIRLIVPRIGRPKKTTSWTIRRGETIDHFETVRQREAARSFRSH